ncbi:Methyltransferase domain [Candidatus Nitrososphaera evergladensis SR1]|uniref:Methyltransferase domain n=1 Tax=Candidatus Nitrososphaera evergladensis SR1 TaxID=1459636 RepID=A0A075MU26_9ARCH|nr:class I SAM-dependent methyltransferase [Candidatus Nitrososphaera evergladensis]AIF82789.1 Methyltransferase domain [Candidatus Nitrososphaera evergladensis SR1]
MFLFGPKAFYKKYVADGNVYPLNHELVNTIMSFEPSSVFEFGCGVGKNLVLLRDKGVKSIFGIDISEAAIKKAKEKGINALRADERHLSKVQPCDVAFTCSVLDHVENIDKIMEQLKRIAQKAVVLMETNDTPAKFYYPHDYESYGFVKTGYAYQSRLPEGDGALYNLYVFKAG